MLDKMSLWRRKDGDCNAAIPDSDLYQGVEDDDIDVDQGDTSAYSKAIMRSTAYSWLIFNLVKESRYHWDEAQPCQTASIQKTHPVLLPTLPGYFCYRGKATGASKTRVVYTG